jgi:hypothetical protein
LGHGIAAAKIEKRNARVIKSKRTTAGAAESRPLSRQGQLLPDSSDEDGRVSEV